MQIRCGIMQNAQCFDEPAVLDLSIRYNIYNALGSRLHDCAHQRAEVVVMLNQLSIDPRFPFESN